MLKRQHGLQGLLIGLGLILLGTMAVRGAGLPDRFTVDTWGTEEGLLPQSSVLAMTQTRDGYLWLGTLNGLVRFDGLHFTVYDESNTPKLESVRIVRLFEDSRSNLWVGTETAGAALIENGNVHPLNIGRGRRAGHLVSICEDSLGAVWLLTEDCQVARYANGEVDVWNLNQGRARSIIAEKGGMVWIATDDQILGVDPAAVRSQAPLPVFKGPPTGQIDLLLASRAGGYWRLADGEIRKCSGTNVGDVFARYPWTGAQRDEVKAACEDRNGNLIVGTGGPAGEGVFWFDEHGSATRISTKEHLSNNSVLSLDADADGNLWVGLDGGGLNRVKRQIFQTLDNTYGSVAQSLCPDARGGLWISAKFQDFHYWKDGVWSTHEAFFGSLSLFNPTAVFVDREQRVWAATRPTHGYGLFALDGAVFRPQEIGSPATGSPKISGIFQDHAGTLWFGTSGGLGQWNGTQWRLFTTSDGLSANIVHAIAEDRAGNLWIGTEGGGLDRFQDGHFTSFQRTNGFPSDNVSAIYADTNDVLWIGTLGDGLVRFSNGKWTHYTTRDGLIGNSIDYLIEDGKGFLWIGSNAGLMRAKLTELDDFVAAAGHFVPCRGYNKGDGLPATECTFGSQPAACQTSDGKLWFPTVAGVVSVDPGQIPFNSNPPPVVIESVLVEEQEITTNGPHAAPPESVTVPPGEEDLEIHYTSLNLGGAERARFRYRLVGRETKWHEAGTQRFARYPTLAPGTFEFQVIACNEDGIWNETGATLAVTVLPLFWQTGWFRAAEIGVLLAIVAATVYFIATEKLQRQVAGFRQQQALEKERARIARDIHDQVGASLTQLALLGEMVEADKDSPEEAEVHARQISQTARETTHALDEIVWTVNPSNDTLEGLVNYICKHAQDYLSVAGLRYRLDVPAQLPAASISPEARHNVFLAAKEAVTNIVKHARATEAWIHLRLEPGKFTLEIEDNGRGPGGVKEKAAESRNGMRNMRKRMEDVGGEFSIEPGAHGGTRVRLTAPFGKC
ncbi:MAG TPA: two-component regulator propeller domain-containing protein [Verrucomicrobiae bacterium]|nr:two-component regulator propeller domain-containing protein [Verrucomicrobiae bacterium]